MQQPFPCGVGVEISAGRNYQPIMMGNSRVNDSIVWIRYETRHIPYDVRTFLHKRGEKKLFIPDGKGKFRLVRVDGYIAHTKTCLEYLECRLVSVPPLHATNTYWLIQNGQPRALRPTPFPQQQDDDSAAQGNRRATATN